mmetsp:Transcript_26857/g.63733  ORF Transcript_26857/g.63733 Transcript_26857/m.63733 type:complete len:110 (-) Transcript_26857:158-487(-)
MNSFRLASALTKRTQANVARSFSKGPIPTSTSMTVDGIKVVGVDHLTNSSMRSAYRSKYWLSDPGSYPLIAILAGAGFFCTGFGLYFLANAPDVQISPAKRNAVMRDWK